MEKKEAIKKSAKNSAKNTAKNNVGNKKLCVITVEVFENGIGTYLEVLEENPPTNLATIIGALELAKENYVRDKYKDLITYKNA
jgi:hypothetical protein